MVPPAHPQPSAPRSRHSAPGRALRPAAGNRGLSKPRIASRRGCKPRTSWEAANACLQFHGGLGFACEYDIERKLRETRLYLVAPISTNLILSFVAEHILGLPRSF